MEKPSGPTLIFLSVALLAALGAALGRADAAFAERMEHWAVSAVALAVGFYTVLDCGIGRRSKK